MSSPDEHISHSLLRPAWHYLNPGASAAQAELYQSSLLSALIEGVYDGDTTFAELEKHGDFGLGTFNALDGEMIAVDGRFYQLRSDGSASPVSPDQKTPFAVVTFFKPEKEIRVDRTSPKADLLKLIEDATELNLFTAVRIDGRFSHVQTRTVGRQVEPYPGLTAAAASQATRSFSDVQGTLAGFHSPPFAQGLEVAGFHLHFLREDGQAGGHALDYVAQDVSIRLATLHSLHVELPTSRAFLSARADGGDLDSQIKEAEG